MQLIGQPVQPVQPVNPLENLTRYLTSLPVRLTSTNLLNIIPEIRRITDTNEFISYTLSLFHDQDNRERQLFTQVKPCQDNIAYVSTHLFGLTPQPIRDLVRQQFINPELSRALTCITDAIIHGPDAPYYARILRWYNRLQQIGAVSEAGNAFNTFIENVEGLYILKTSKPGVSDVILHEYLVGMVVTNSLRRLIPNFSYIYGAFNCAPPLVREQTREVVAWCTNNTQISYVVYENVAPARTVRDYLFNTPNLGEITYLSYFMQIVFAIRLAHQVSDFTHYDLHDENALLREVENVAYFYIPYPTEQGVEYLLTNRVVTIIDYGTSHFRHDGIHYGPYNLFSIGFLPNRSNPMADIYKFLLFTARDAFDPQARMAASVKTAMRKIFRFFNQTESLDNAVAIQQNYYYTWPSYNPLLTVDGFLKYMREQFPELRIILKSAPTGSIPILNCQSLRCQALQEIFTIGGLVEGKIPENFFDLYDLLLHYKDPNQQRQILSRFPYQTKITTAVPEFLAETNRLLTDLRTFQNDTVAQVIPLLSPGEQNAVNLLIRDGLINSNGKVENIWLRNLQPLLIFNPGIYALYKFKVYRFADIYFRLVKLRLSQVAILTVGKLYNDTLYAPQIEVVLNELIVIANVYAINFSEDNDAIKLLLAGIQPLLVDRYKWYWVTLEILLQIMK